MTVQYEPESARQIPDGMRDGIWSQHGVDPAGAWDSLLRGEWVVAEHSEGASSRTTLARSAAAHFAQEALNAGEIRMATRRARGQPVKSIAIELGCSDAAVHRCIASVMRKLQVRSQADLVALLQERSPWGLTASRSRSSAEDLLVLTYPMPFWALPPCLTRAEQGIVLDLIGGASQCDIGKARGSSPRTVANQVASIFRKLNVCSRIELFVALRPR